MTSKIHGIFIAVSTSQCSTMEYDVMTSLQQSIFIHKNLISYYQHISFGNVDLIFVISKKTFPMAS